MAARFHLDSQRTELCFGTHRPCAAVLLLLLKSATGFPTLDGASAGSCHFLLSMEREIEESRIVESSMLVRRHLCLFQRLQVKDCILSCAAPACAGALCGELCQGTNFS